MHWLLKGHVAPAPLSGICLCCTGIKDAQSNVVKLRQVLDAVTSGVQEGRAQQQHQRQLALSRKLRPVPYSPWLSQPFLKVCMHVTEACFPGAQLRAPDAPVAACFCRLHVDNSGHSLELLNTVCIVVIGHCPS